MNKFDYNYYCGVRTMRNRAENHSKNFWAEMDKIVGDGKRLRKEMRGCRIGV